MFKRLRQWMDGSSSWSRAHETSWQGEDVRGASGLTPFQERCEAELRRVLSSRALAFRDRALVEGTHENYVHGFIGDTDAEVWIYLDQAELRIPGGRHVNLERAGARTPADLVRDFITAVREAVE